MTLHVEASARLVRFVRRTAALGLVLVAIASPSEAPAAGKATGAKAAPPAPKSAPPKPAPAAAPKVGAHGKSGVKGARPKPPPPLPKGYANSVRAWHTATPGKTAPVDAAGRPKLVLYALNTTERVELTALSDKGGFSASDLDHAAQLLRDPRTGNEHPVEPRLLDSVYRIARHFSAHEIRVVSGYRTPKPSTHSNHGRGRAMDMVVPGATDDDVAKFAREAGFSGVGVYPVSGFVHVDVRERSYFWVDSSGPGRKSRLYGVLADVAARADSTALARGDRPMPTFTLLGDVDAALAAREKAYAATHADPASPATVHEEDEDMESVGGAD